MIIVTCITNGYDEIPDDNYYDPDVQYVCYTDGSIEKKGPWEFRDIPIQHDCPLRLALYPKIMMHECFPIGSQVVWIDGCYKHTRQWVELSKKLFPRTHLLHPKRFTYYEEIVEGYVASFQTKESVIEVTQTAKDMGFNFKTYTPLALATFWQTVDEESIPFNEKWWEFSQISTRCDQIGFNVARQVTGLTWGKYDGYFTCGIDFTWETGKSGRKKLHPQIEDKEQWRKEKEILQELKHITKLRPEFYYKNGLNFDKWVNRHIWNPDLTNA
tara:strand:+ start:6458 stop:7270 length:813 start_codon:yes stop_codon:yes gene_type:complete